MKKPSPVIVPKKASTESRNVDRRNPLPNEVAVADAGIDREPVAVEIERYSFVHLVLASRTMY